jgi:hypothetical protein
MALCCHTGTPFLARTGDWHPSKSGVVDIWNAPKQKGGQNLQHRGSKLEMKVATDLGFSKTEPLAPLSQPIPCLSSTIRRLLFLGSSELLAMSGGSGKKF